MRIIFINTTKFSKEILGTCREATVNSKYSESFILLKEIQ